MIVMSSIEFFTYSPARTWGVRVDGLDLRAHAADAVRPLWKLEGHDSDVEGFLFNQHGGLTQDELEDPVAHFLGDGLPGVRQASTAATALLGCTCGVWECWPLLADVTTTSETVTWSSFRQPHRQAWGELPLGPFPFDRPTYEDALTHAVHFPEDPFTSLPPSTD